MKIKSKPKAKKSRWNGFELIETPKKYGRLAQLNKHSKVPHSHRRNSAEA